MTSTELTVYRLTGSPTAALKLFLANPTQVKMQEKLASNLPWPNDTEAIFAYTKERVDDLPWLQSVRTIFLETPKIGKDMTRGAIILRTNGQVYAIPFGPGGSSLIEQSKIVRGWGRRIALNLIYDQSGILISNGSALRKGRASRLGGGLVTEVQSSKEVTLDILGFDYAQDILRSVTVVVDRAEWGKYAEGSDSFRLRWSGIISSLPRLCIELENLHRPIFYQKHFSFIDNLRAVVDSKLLNSVWEKVASDIQIGKTESLGLTTSSITDFVGTDLDLFGVTGRPAKRGGHRLDGFSIGDYRSMLVTLGSLSNLDAAEIKKQQLRASSGDVKLLQEPVHRWVEGTVMIGAATYALNDGDVYEVSSDFLAELDNFIDDIEAGATSRLGLPAFMAVPLRSKKTKNGIKLVRDELAFNQEVSRSGGRLCLDGKNVITIPTRTSPIEFCDVLMSGREFLHAKIGTASATLSHLFSQASVSAELLLDSAQFRNQARATVRKVARSVGVPAPPFEQMIPLSLTSGVQYTIVLAIIDERWTPNSLPLARVSTVLPFFSKINARTAIRRMRGRAFSVEIARVGH